MRKWQFFFIPVLLFLSSQKALSWGGIGHRIVAETARLYLEPGVADSVQYYLGDMTFREAATWMDEVRSDSTIDYMKPMHYINVEKGKKYVRVAGPNILNEIHITIKSLKDRSGKSKEETAFLLKKLFHLIGDLGQPLHTGYGADRGGNTVDVTFINKKTNLHHVWDSDIIERQGISADHCRIFAEKWSKRKIRHYQEIDLERWMDDSRKLLPGIYKFENALIDQQYVDKNTPVIEKQLFISGIRLASVLNECFR